MNEKVIGIFTGIAGVQSTVAARTASRIRSLRSSGRTESRKGKKIDMPPIRQIGATFKKAEKFKGKEGEKLELKEK